MPNAYIIKMGKGTVGSTLYLYTSSSMLVNTSSSRRCGDGGTLLLLYIVFRIVVIFFGVCVRLAFVACCEYLSAFSCNTRFLIIKKKLKEG